jgi:hypothetical protein
MRRIYELHDETGSRRAKSKHSKSMRSGDFSSKASSIVRKREENGAGANEGRAVEDSATV